MVQKFNGENFDEWASGNFDEKIFNEFIMLMPTFING